jgi:hypothetical protein
MMRPTNRLLIGILTGLCACTSGSEGEGETIADDFVLEDDDVDSSEGTSTDTESTTTDSSETDAGETDSGETNGTSCHDLEELPDGSTCDPLVQDCPPPNDCHELNGAFKCVSGNDYVEGDECIAEHDCAAGYTCVSASLAPFCSNEMVGCCTKFCDLACPVCDFPGTACAAFSNPVVGFEDVGYCRAQ